MDEPRYVYLVVMQTADGESTDSVWTSAEEAKKRGAELEDFADGRYPVYQKAYPLMDAWKAEWVRWDEASVVRNARRLPRPGGEQ